MTALQDTSSPHAASVTKPTSAPTVVQRHGLLEMTYLALTKGFAPENGGTFARVRGEHFSAFQIGLRKYVVLQNPEDLEYVLVTNRANFPKGPDYEILKGVLGNGLFTDDFESWERHRELLNPVFQKKNVTGLLDRMITPIEAELARLERGPDGQEVDMVSAMTDLTLEVVGNALFSQSFKGYLGDDAADAMTEGLRLGTLFLRLFILVQPPKWVTDAAWKIMHSERRLPPPVGDFQRIQARFNKFCRSVVDTRIKNPTQDDDVLNLMLRAKDEQGKMTAERVYAEGITLMLAGHETTANGLSWFWYLMATHPEARDRMLEEIDTVLQGRTPTVDDIPKLKWTMACFDEALRLRPPAYGITRQAVHDDVIGGHPIEAGTTVWILVCNIHMDPRFWPEPEKFDPSRFMPGAPKRPILAFIPFGGGKRICIARNFALQEVALIIAMLSQRYVYDLVPGQNVEPETTFTLRPKDKIRMIARRRHRTQA